MRNLLFGILLLSILSTHASNFKRIDLSFFEESFAQDSSLVSKLSFDKPENKVVDKMIKPGLNLQELTKRNSIILFDRVKDLRYVPDFDRDFSIDQEGRIFLKIKYDRMEFAEFRFDFDKKIISTIYPDITTISNFGKSKKNWVNGKLDRFNIYPISNDLKTSENNTLGAIFFSLSPPAVFSFTFHNSAYDWDKYNIYQMIVLPTLEDLINILDKQTQSSVTDYILSNKEKIDFASCLKSPTLKSLAEDKSERIKANELASKSLAEQQEAKAKTDAEEKAQYMIQLKANDYYEREIHEELFKSKLLLPRDEFESSESYAARQKKAEKFKNDLNKKYAIMYKENNERKESDRIEKIKKSYEKIKLDIVQIGTYNAERQTFPITFAGHRPMELNIPFQEAKSFKENLKNVKVVADKQLKEDGITYQIFNFEVTHPITGSKYTLFKSSPLYLDHVTNDSNFAETGFPKLDVKVDFIEPSGNKLLDGDEKARFEVTIQNSGTGVARNVKVNLSSIDNLGFTYDKDKLVTGIAPNKSQTVIFEINASRNILTKEIPFLFDIEESRGFNPGKTQISIKTQSFRAPNLAFKGFTIKKLSGSNDNIIKNLEPIEVTVLVQNTGQGKTENAKAVFNIKDKNIMPLSPDKMAHALGEINPGESKLIKFEFMVNSLYSGSDELPIDVILSEKYGEYGGTIPLKIEMKKVQMATQTIKLSGEHYDQKIDIKDISLIAETDKNIPETGVKNEDRYALIIGNEDYKNSQPDLNSEINVLFAENDAKTLKEYSVKTLGVPEENITLLINATAGKMKQYLAKINLIAKNSNGKAELIFYYAGHGLPDENTKEPYLIPVDVSGSNFKEGGIKLAEVYTKLTEYPTKKVTVFIDACFSGGARNQGLLSTRSIKMKPKESILTGNIVVFSASNGEQSSLPYTDKQHGMFTYFLLKKIQDTKGEISLKDLFDSINEKVSLQSVNINNKEQTPVVNSGTDSWGNWTLR